MHCNIALTLTLHPRPQLHLGGDQRQRLALGFAAIKPWAYRFESGQPETHSLSFLVQGKWSHDVTGKTHKVRGNEWVRLVFAVNSSKVTVVANGTQIVSMDASDLSCSKYAAPGCLNVGAGFTVVNGPISGQTFREPYVFPPSCDSAIRMQSGVHSQNQNLHRDPRVCDATTGVASSSSLELCRKWKRTKQELTQNRTRIQTNETLLARVRRFAPPPACWAAFSWYYSAFDIRREKLLGKRQIRDQLAYPDKAGRMVIEEEMVRYGRRFDLCLSGVAFFAGSDWSEAVSESDAWHEEDGVMNLFSLSSPPPPPPHSSLSLPWT